MREEGVAGLSLSEVARRVGVRPPSIYQYFPSKMAIYDALFERGMRATVEAIEQYLPMLADDPLAAIAAGQQAAYTWAMANPLLAQLMYWRPVPGFEPSERAFKPALRQVELLRIALQAAVDAGQLAAAAASEDGVVLFTALGTGLISQQLSNEPTAPVEKGGFTRLTPTALDMFFSYYAPKESAENDRVSRRRRRTDAD